MADRAAIEATIEAYVEAMSAGDKEAWLDLFSESPRVEDPVGAPAHEGREALSAFWDLVRGMADRLTLERTGPVRVAGGEAAWPLRAYSQIGEDRLVVDIIDVMTFDEEGRITGLRAFWDASEMRPA